MAKRRHSALDAAEKYVEAAGRVRAGFGALALIGGGAVLAWGSGPVAEEVPWHFALGIGLAGFGVVFGAALILDTLATTRRWPLTQGLKSLTAALLAYAVAAGVG
jgi:hypothetical protein